MSVYRIDCSMTTFILVTALASLLIGLSKGGLGGPVPVAMLTPLMSLVIPASQAVGIVLPLLIFADVFALVIYWRKWDPQRVRLMLPIAIVGVVMGGLLLLLLADSHQDLVLRRILGFFTLIVAVYKLASEQMRSLRYQPQNWHGYLAGWAAGFGSALANVGAPPFTAYMLLQKVDPTAFIGTTTLFFAIINILKLPFALMSRNILDIQLMLNIAWAFLLIPLGVWIGRTFVNRINPRSFEKLMLTLLFILGLFMLFYTPS